MPLGWVNFPHKRFRFKLKKSIGKTFIYKRHPKCSDVSTAKKKNAGDKM